MSPKLNEEQLKQIIVEVGEMSRRQETELDREQIQEILRELNLPPELLDEAIIQLRRRQALAHQRRRDRFVLGGIAIALVVAISTTVWFIQRNHSAIANIQVQRDRITLTEDDGGGLNRFARQNNPELFYRVTLEDAPVGEKLNLVCHWIDPNGQTVKQNRYQTQTITTPVWNTHCRYNLGTGAKTGTWQVQMFLGDRLLGEEKFTVE